MERLSVDEQLKEYYDLCDWRFNERLEGRVRNTEAALGGKKNIKNKMQCFRLLKTLANGEVK